MKRMKYWGLGLLLVGFFSFNSAGLWNTLILENSPNVKLFLTFGLAVIGGLMYVIPDLKLEGLPGIKNDGIFQNPATNKGWIAWLIFGYLIGFYILLYFYP